MNNIRLIQQHSSSSSATSSHNLLGNANTNAHKTQQQPPQPLLAHNLQLAPSSLQPHSVVLPPFATPGTYAAFAYNPENYIHNPQPACYGQQDYGHELYSTETMLTTQPQHGSAFLQLGQPIETHAFHGFQLKQESEAEPFSDESSEHGGVIRRAQRSKHSKDFLSNKVPVITSEISSLAAQQQNCPSHSDIFCYVPGRLSLLSSSTKYQVTVAEIGRRINPPEALNASVLGSILRKAKAKDGGKSLRDQLKTHGLVLPAGRRKASNVNSLTALVEHEASQLASDFEKLCENEFPSRTVAEYLSRLHIENNPAPLVEQRKKIIHMTKQLINEFCEVLSKDGSPLCNNPPAHSLDPAIQNSLSHFSLVTHGFGSRAVRAGLNAFSNYLDESLKLLDAK